MMTDKDKDVKNVGEDVCPQKINEEWKAACDAVMENDDD